MKKTIFALLLAVTGLSTTYSQVGIGTTNPDASSLLDVNTDNLPANGKKGFLPPRMTSIERNAIINPAEGLTVYNTDDNCLQFFKGTYWFNLCNGTIASGACDGEKPEFTFNGLTYKPVESSGKCWLDRNLGALSVTGTARSTYPDNAAYITAEEASFGHLYQWGRSSDGHENRNSNSANGQTSTYPVTTPAGNESNFLFGFDNWYSGLNPDDLWVDLSGNKTANDPCPAGYRIPTSLEWLDEINSWGANNNADGAFASPLRLAAAGRRRHNNGLIDRVGSWGYYWSSSVVGTDASRLAFKDDNSNRLATIRRALGNSVRCIRE